MDMDMGGMDMGNMSMGSGIPSLNSLQQIYWAIVGAVIAAFFLANVYVKLLCWQRLAPPLWRYFTKSRH